MNVEVASLYIETRPQMVFCKDETALLTDALTRITQFSAVSKLQDFTYLLGKNKLRLTFNPHCSPQDTPFIKGNHRLGWYRIQLVTETTNALDDIVKKITGFVQTAGQGKIIVHRALFSEQFFASYSSSGAIQESYMGPAYIEPFYVYKENPLKNPVNRN